MILDEMTQELKQSWRQFHIQGLLVVNLLIALVAIVLQWPEGDEAVLFGRYLSYLSLVMPLALIALFMIRDKQAILLGQISKAQLYWWGMSDISVGTGVLLVWLFLILFKGSLPLIGALAVYISFLCYAMLIMSAVICAYAWKRSAVLASFVAIVLHLSLYVLALWAVDVELTGLRVLPFNLIADPTAMVTLSYSFGEFITPLAFCGVIILLLRNRAVRFV